MTDWYKMNPVDWNEGTDDLTLEQEGAYLRICNAIYISERPIRDNMFVVAGLLRCSDRKARRLVDDLVRAGKLVIQDEHIVNRRAVDEVSARVRLRVERQSSGSRGGVKSAESRSNQLKINNPPQASASSKNEAEEKRQEESRAEPRARTFFYDRLITAASSRGPCHQNLAMGIRPMTDLVRQGYSEDELVEVVAEKAKPEINSWNYYSKVAQQRAADRASIIPKPKAPEADWNDRLRGWREDRTWATGWGPPPDEPGCKAPAELLRTAA